MTAEPDARRSLTDHAADKGQEIRRKYGPRIGWAELGRILADPDCVRYPCELVFASDALQPGELAFPEPKGERPEAGYVLQVHPYFALDPSRVPLIALYQLVAINYGGFASAEDAETFGAAALGLDREAYYQTLCAMADELDPAAASAEAPSSLSCGPRPSC